LSAHNAFQDAADDARRSEQRRAAYKRLLRRLQGWMAETDEALNRLELLNIANADLRDERKRYPQVAELAARKLAQTPTEIIEKIEGWCEYFELEFHPRALRQVQHAINTIDAVQSRLMPMVRMARGTYRDLGPEQYLEDDGC
jgi:DNA repair ATPase RecN